MRNFGQETQKMYVEYLSKHSQFCHIGAGVLTNTIHFHFRLHFLHWLGTNWRQASTLLTTPWFSLRMRTLCLFYFIQFKSTYTIMIPWNGPKSLNSNRSILTLMTFWYQHLPLSTALLPNSSIHHQFMPSGFGNDYLTWFTNSFNMNSTMKGTWTPSFPSN